MQRINNFSKWAKLEEGTRIDFANDKPRIVRLDVNAPDPMKLYILNQDDEAFFLARIVGRDVVEFHVTEAFSLTAEGGEVNLYSVDGDDISFRILDRVSFTKIVERRRRNPELEEMMFMMNKNMDRRLTQQADELARLFTARQSEQLALNAPTGVSRGAGSEPQQDDNGDSSDSSSPGTDNGGVTYGDGTANGGGRT